MKEVYVIVNLQGRLFFYGFYENKTWTVDVVDARTYDSSEDAENYLKSNSEFIGGFYEIIKIHIPT
jgi:hypothetical protein